MSYIVNKEIVGYNTLELKDETIKDVKESNVFIVVNKELEENDKATEYRAVKKLIENKNRVFIIGTEKSNTFRVMATLLVSMSKYDVYLVMSEEDINPSYLDTCVEREPTLVEVQEYIGGDIVAYSDITTMLYMIESYVADEDIESLQRYIEENGKTLSNMAMAIDFMKKSADLTNSKEATLEIEDLRNKLSSTKMALSNAEQSIEELREAKSGTAEDNEKAKREREELLEKIKDLQNQLENGVSVINNYKELNITYEQHKIQRVLYFKEISYIPYIRSFVTNLAEMMSKEKLRVKLVIYDNQTDMYEQYTESGMRVISGKNYSGSKGTITGDNPFVVSEPNLAITKAIIGSEEGYDVLIIYDKMHKYENIIEGNNVTRIYVTSSSNEFMAVRGKLKLKVGDIVLTRQNSRVMEIQDVPCKDNIMDITEIEGYTELSDSAKINRYRKLMSTRNTVLFEKIYEVSNIRALMRR